MSLSPTLDRFLRSMEYPAVKDDLLREAARDGLSAEDTALLELLPEQSFAARWHVRHVLARIARAESALVPA
ncbi:MULTISPECIES: DUF2795 domain-containing protein [Microbacterium]|uniref:DUF2795 domain-containing protein n=1 Tax=Microbacterium TaxID=33882 RepID=UPI00217E826F|nr:MULTISPECIES: DUF2795 domain-containing protein [Microbacterium]UWF76807.1 DUF2795 domain-containing protein [Microbacterium neungamense]WCM54957.1 DUF2795 domain-containing protein [Microbacterium sp. EF45047]